MKIFVLYLVLILGLIDCSKDKNLKSGDLLTYPLFLNDTTEIALHKLYINQENNISIKLDSVLSDSRCPTGALCIWAGVAAVRFDFTFNDTHTKFNLYTLSAWHKDTTISGYKIHLIDLNPYPQLSVHIKYDDYKAKIIITN